MSSKICLQCRQPTNDTYNRLVCDSCGHYKCRSCLLSDDTHCYACFESSVAVKSNADTNTDVEKNNHKSEQSLITVISNKLISNGNHMQESTRDSLILHSNDGKQNDLNGSHSKNKNESKDFSVPAKSLIKYTIQMRDSDVSITDNNELQATNNNVNFDSEMQLKSFPNLTSDINKDGYNVKELQDKNGMAVNTFPVVIEEHNIIQKSFNKKRQYKKDNILIELHQENIARVNSDNNISKDHKNNQNAFNSTDSFSCIKCSETFEHQSLLDEHESTHKKSKFVICDYCNASFDRKSKLIRHFSVHIDQRIHECLVCHSKFSNMQSLTNHSRRHSGIKPYTCNECGKKYRDASNIRRHKLLHSGNYKIYACPQCDKKYKKKFSLNVHLKIHNNDKTVICTYCPRTFYTKSDQKRHELTHTGRKQFRCKFCKTVFKRKDNFFRHLRNVHSEEPIDESIYIIENIERVITQTDNINVDINDISQIENNCLIDKNYEHGNNDLEVMIPSKTLCSYTVTSDITDVPHINKSDTPSRLKILEANTNRESVIFKPIFNLKYDEIPSDAIMNYDNDMFNRNEFKHLHNHNDFVHSASELKSAEDFLEYDRNTFQNVNNYDKVVAETYAKANDESNRSGMSVNRMQNNMFGDANYDDSHRGYENKLNAYNKRYSETQYIHKKVNYDHKMENKHISSFSPSQIPQDYMDFDDAKASWCLHQFSRSNNESEEGLYSKKQCTPESIELYKKILFPSYTSNNNTTEYYTDSNSHSNADDLNEKKKIHAVEASAHSMSDERVSNEKNVSDSDLQPHEFENHWKRKITKKSQTQSDVQ